MPLSSFYNYPFDVPQFAELVNSLNASDDGFSSEIPLSTAFPFFGVNQTAAYVSQSRYDTRIREHNDMHIGEALNLLLVLLFQVNNNGVVSFGSSFPTFRTAPFPFIGTPTLAPYWGDVDTRGTGTVWYQQTDNSTLLSMARDDVLAVYPTFTFFNPTNLLIATWDHVGYYNNGTDRVSFTRPNCILICDSSYSLTFLLCICRQTHFNVS